MLLNDDGTMDLSGIEVMNHLDFYPRAIDRAEELKALFDKSGIKVWSIGSPIGKIEIDDSKKLLLYTNYPVFKISEMAGFNDQNYFARIFKKIYGRSPLKVRKYPASPDPSPE